MRRIAPVIVLALASLLLFEGVALATGTTETTFRMNDEGSYVEYKGRVSSNSDRCIANRKISIYHNGILIASTETDADGRWETTGPRPPDGDAVTVKVKKKRKNRRTICAGDQVTRTFQAD